MTPQSKGLIGLFQGQTECKKNKFGEPKVAIKLVLCITIVEKGLVTFHFKLNSCIDFSSLQFSLKVIQHFFFLMFSLLDILEKSL